MSAAVKTTQPNGFEYKARAAKVARLLALVPLPERPEHVGPTAAYVSQLTYAQRYELARQAGTLYPSDTTWRHLIAAIWARGSLQDRWSA